jgi:hypothetical protein
MDWRDLEKVVALADAFQIHTLVVKYLGKDHYNLVFFDQRDHDAQVYGKFVVLHISPPSTAADVRYYPEDAPLNDTLERSAKAPPKAPAKSNKRRRRS